MGVNFEEKRLSLFARTLRRVQRKRTSRSISVSKALNSKEIAYPQPSEHSGRPYILDTPPQISIRSTLQTIQDRPTVSAPTIHNDIESEMSLRSAGTAESTNIHRADRSGSSSSTIQQYSTHGGFDSLNGSKLHKAELPEYLGSNHNLTSNSSKGSRHITSRPSPAAAHNYPVHSSSAISLNLDRDQETMFSDSKREFIIILKGWKCCNCARYNINTYNCPKDQNWYATSHKNMCMSMQCTHDFCQNCAVVSQDPKNGRIHAPKRNWKWTGDEKAKKEGHASFSSP